MRPSVNEPRNIPLARTTLSNVASQNLLNQIFTLKLGKMDNRFPGGGEYGWNSCVEENGEDQ